MKMKTLRSCQAALTLAIGAAFGFHYDVQAAVKVIPDAIVFDKVTGGDDFPLKPVEVTTLADSGPGSLRQAFGTRNCRKVIFKVSGTIKLKDDLWLKQGFGCIVVDGATSPGGITLENAGIAIQVGDVTIRNLRIHPGDRAEGKRFDDRDGIKVIAGTDSKGNQLSVKNVLIENNTILWAMDEAVTTYFAGVEDVLIRRNIIGETLYNSKHPKGVHSMGLLVGNHTKRIRVYENVLVSNAWRNPVVKSSASAIVANNVIYNPGNTIHFYPLETDDNQPAIALISRNMIIPGPNTVVNKSKLRMDEVEVNSNPFKQGLGKGSRVMMDRNYLNLGIKGKGLQFWRLDHKAIKEEVGYNPMVSVAPLSDVDMPKANMTIPNAVKQVLDGAGALPERRDASEQRIMQEIATFKGGYKNTPPVGEF